MNAFACVNDNRILIIIRCHNVSDIVLMTGNPKANYSLNAVPNVRPTQTLTTATTTPSHTPNPCICKSSPTSTSTTNTTNTAITVDAITGTHPKVHTIARRTSAESPQLSARKSSLKSQQQTTPSTAFC